jgi:hypothetical protein
MKKDRIYFKLNFVQKSEKMTQFFKKDLKWEEISSRTNIIF